MPISDYVGGYGGTQKGQPYLWLNPETGQVEYRDGDDMEVSPNSKHSSVGHLLATQLPNFAAPLGAAGLDMLAGPTVSSFSGSAMGSAPGYMAPSAAPAALPASPLAVSPYVGPAAIGSGAPTATLASATTGATAAGGASPTFAAPAATAAAPAATSAAGPVAAAAAPAAGGIMSRINWGDLAQTGLGLGVDAMNNRRSNNASDEALRQQQMATDAAMAENRAAFSPYMNLGSGAASILGGLSGIPMGGGGAAGAMVPPSATTPQARPDDITAAPARRGGMLGANPDARANRAALSSLNQASAPARTQSGFVRMRDDDGEEMDIPVNRVEELERMGAQRVRL